MGRKSLKTERVREILDAFDRCLERKGLQATTLDNVAEEAGLARRMIRHYVGNRDDLVDAAVKRILEKYNRSIFEFIGGGDEKKRFGIALDYIFSETFNALPATKLVAALLPVSLYDEQVRIAVKSLYTSFHQNLEEELKQRLPGVPAAKRRRTAYSVMCLSFGGGWMFNIGFDAALNQHNRKLAQGLIDQLS